MRFPKYQAARPLLVSFALGAVLIFVGSQAASAQRGGPPPPPINFFAGVRTLKCVFTTYATTTWKDGQPQVQLKTTDVEQMFSDIDAQGGTARATWAGGGADIVARLSTFSLHFLEVTSAGSLKATTVFNQESRPNRLKAVYAQHDYLRMSLPGFEAQPTVSQYYGECESVL